MEQSPEDPQVEQSPENPQVEQSPEDTETLQGQGRQSPEELQTVQGGQELQESPQAVAQQKEQDSREQPQAAQGQEDLHEPADEPQRLEALNELPGEPQGQELHELPEALRPTQEQQQSIDLLGEGAQKEPPVCLLHAEDEQRAQETQAPGLEEILQQTQEPLRPDPLGPAQDLEQRPGQQCPEQQNIAAIGDWRKGTLLFPGRNMLTMSHNSVQVIRQYGPGPACRKETADEKHRN